MPRGQSVEQRMKRWWRPAAAIAAILLSLSLLVYLLRPPDPNAEMAETAREAVQMARDAREDAESARRRGYTVRVVALVVGVSVPLMVAYLIYRSSERSEPGLEDVLEVMEEEGLLDGSDHADEDPTLEKRRDRWLPSERDDG